MATQWYALDTYQKVQDIEELHSMGFLTQNIELFGVYITQGARCHLC